MERIIFPKLDRVPWNPDKRETGVKDVIGWMTKLNHQPVVITEKIDGDYVCMTRDAIYDQNGEDLSEHKVWDNIKEIWKRYKDLIPSGYYILGEEFHAKRTIEYNRCLDNFFYRVFAIVRAEDMLVLGMDETLDRIMGINFGYVPIFSQTDLDISKWVNYDYFIRPTTHSNYSSNVQAEGYVIRFMGEFPFSKLRAYMLKYTRPGYIKPDKESWLSIKRHVHNTSRG